MNATLQLTAGLLLRRKLREFLQRCKFTGMRIEWLESGGLLERVFDIRGNYRDLDKIEQSFKKWARENKWNVE